MDKKQIFGKHYERLAAERLIKSIAAGAIVGFGINTVFAVIYWMLNFGSVWLGAAIGLPAGATVGILLYFLKYRLTEKTLARRIDRSAELEERMITMVELEGDNSCIAELQRKDAVKNLNALSEKSVKVGISNLLAVTLTALIIISLAFNVLGIMAKNGKMPYGKDMLAQGADGTFEVIYTTDGGGYIRGEAEQEVSYGGSTSYVRAIADDGWKFVSWDDGETSPERNEENVSSNMTFKAVFVKIDGNDPDEDDNDSADDLPEGSAFEEGSGGESDEEGGDNIKEDGEGNGGGKWQDRNQFIDGATYYRDYLEFYYQYAMGIFDSDSDIPPEIIDFFETYFSGI